VAMDAASRSKLAAITGEALLPEKFPTFDLL
jgi:hypothetical protein